MEFGLVEYGMVAVVGIVVVVLVAAFSKKLGVAAPLLLVLVGIGYSFVPGVPQIVIDPELILMGVLPPILYAAAIQVPMLDFRRDFLSISALSVVLVIVSALVTGTVIWMILPQIGLATAIALGAVISPPDVVAATAIGKRLRLPPRLLSILEGEGLVNDATALVLLRTAIAAAALTASDHFSIWAVLGDFGYAVIVAVGVGLLVGVISVAIRRRLDDPVLDTAISFAVPFIAYIPAERLHASGVIAVVVLGLFSGHHSARFSPQSRMAERFNWRTVQFVLENGVFLLMGMELATIVSQVEGHLLPVEGAVLLGLFAAGMLIVIRFSFVWPLLALVRAREQARIARAHELEARFGRVIERNGDAASPWDRRRAAAISRRIDRWRNEIAQLRTEGLSWRGGVVIGWAGMRGVVTLAAAQSLPRDNPYYAPLVLVAFTVAVTTLLLHGLTLPFVIRWTGVRGADDTADRRDLAALLDEMATAALGMLEHREFRLADGERVDDAVVERLRRNLAMAVEAARERAEHADGDTGVPRSHQQYRELRREALQAERDVLLDARSRGAYPSRVLQRAQALLDLEEARLQEADTRDGH